MIEQSRDTLIVRIAKIPGRLGMSAFYNYNSAGSVPYNETACPEKDISALCEKISDILSDIGKTQDTQRSSLMALREAGRSLFEIIFTADIKERIRKAGADYLIFSIDSGLMGVPWELLHDGREFLCLRFAMSRNIGHHEFTGVEYREVKRTLKALVLAPASPRMGMTYNEGIDVINELYAAHGRIETSLQIMEVELAFVNANIKGRDMVHYVGHVDYDLQEPSRSGWVFNDGILSAEKIRALAVTGPFPAFVFSDAYQPGSPDKWPVKRSCMQEAQVPASAFLSAGVKHYIGTFWNIPDEARLLFVKEFYGLVLAGERIGDAMRLARSRLIDKYSASPLFWASYTLYGDPAMTVFEESAIRPPAVRSPERRRAAPFGRRSSDKIKAALLMLAVFVSTLAVNRLFTLASVLNENDKTVREIGAGLKYLASLKQEKEDAAHGFTEGPGTFRYGAKTAGFDWTKLVVNIHRALRGEWAIGQIAPSGRARPSALTRTESAVLYRDIFSFDRKVYLDALIGYNAAKPSVIKDDKTRKYFTKAKIRSARGEYATALKSAQKAFDSAWMMDDRRDESAALALCFALHAELKQGREALACVLQNRTIAEKSGDAAWEADAHFKAGLGYLLRQNYGATGKKDIKELEQALKIYRSMNDNAGIVRSYLMLGYAYASGKEYDKALARIDDGLKAAAKAGDAASQGLLYKAFGDIHSDKMKYAAARVYYGEALIMTKTARTKEGALAYLDTLYRLAFLDLASSNHERCADFYQRIAGYTKEAKDTKLKDRYKNIFNCLNTLIGQKEGISRRAIRLVYLEMAACYLKARDYRMADHCLDRALE